MIYNEWWVSLRYTHPTASRLPPFAKFLIILIRSY